MSLSLTTISVAGTSQAVAVTTSPAGMIPIAQLVNVNSDGTITQYAAQTSGALNTFLTNTNANPVPVTFGALTSGNDSVQAINGATVANVTTTTTTTQTLGPYNVSMFRNLIVDLIFTTLTGGTCSFVLQRQDGTGTWRNLIASVSAAAGKQWTYWIGTGQASGPSFDAGVNDTAVTLSIGGFTQLQVVLTLSGVTAFNAALGITGV